MAGRNLLPGGDPLHRISLSDTWETIFGFTSPSGSFRKALTEGAYLHPDDLPLLLDRFRSLENGSPYEMQEVRFATSRGRYLWCRVRASALRDEKGRLSRIVGLIVNIDEEKVISWIKKGAQPTDTVRSLLSKQGIMKKIHEERKSKN